MSALRILNSLAVLAIGFRTFAGVLDPGVLPKVFVIWDEPDTMIDIYVGAPPWNEPISPLWVALMLALLCPMTYAILTIFRESEKRLVRDAIVLGTLAVAWFLYPLFEAAAPVWTISRW